MTAIEPMVRKPSRFFNVPPRSKRKPHDERLKDFTAPKPLEPAPIMPHYEIQEPVGPPQVSKAVSFKEIQENYSDPEFKLLRAIVIRAYTDLTRKAFSTNEDLRDARTWILSSSTDPFSFLWIVEHLDLSDGFVKLFRKFACDTFN